MLWQVFSGWTGDHKFWALLISYCFGMIGHHMLIWISGIERISTDYYEAAGIDGANKIKQFFFHITLPLLKGILRTNIIMWSISVAGFFIWSQLFSPLTPDTSTVVPMVYMYVKLLGPTVWTWFPGMPEAAPPSALFSVSLL